MSDSVMTMFRIMEVKTMSHTPYSMGLMDHAKFLWDNGLQQRRRRFMMAPMAHHIPVGSIAYHSHASAYCISRSSLHRVS
jgi:hypothetical protein